MASFSLGNQTTNGDVATPNVNAAQTANPLQQAGQGLGTAAQQLANALVGKQANALVSGNSGSGAAVGTNAVNDSSAPVGNTFDDTPNLTDADFQNLQDSQVYAGSNPVPGQLGSGPPADSPNMGPNLPPGGNPNTSTQNGLGANAGPLAANSPGSVLANTPPGQSAAPFPVSSGSSADVLSADAQNVAATKPSNNGGFAIPGQSSPAPNSSVANMSDADFANMLTNDANYTTGNPFLDNYAKQRGIPPQLVANVALKNGYNVPNPPSANPANVPSPDAQNTNAATSSTNFKIPGGTTGLLAKTYIDAGLSPNAAAGVIGNQGQESNFNTSSIGDGGTSGGLSQWHGPRFAAMQAAAQAQGVDWRDPVFQANYTVSDLKNNYPSVLAAANAASTPAEAADIISKGYESPNPAKANNANREAIANSIAGGASLPLGSGSNGSSGGIPAGAGLSNFGDTNMAASLQQVNSAYAQAQSIISNPNASYAAKQAALDLTDRLSPYIKEGADIRNNIGTQDIGATNALTSQGDLALRQAQYLHPNMDIHALPDNSLVGVNPRTGEVTPITGAMPEWSPPSPVNDRYGRPNGSFIQTDKLGNVRTLQSDGKGGFTITGGAAGPAVPRAGAGAGGPAAATPAQSPAVPAQPAAPAQKSPSAPAVAATVAASQNPDKTTSGAAVGIDDATANAGREALAAPLMSPPPGVQGAPTAPLSSQGTLSQPPVPMTPEEIVQPAPAPAAPTAASSTLMNPPQIDDATANAGRAALAAPLPEPPKTTVPYDKGMVDDGTGLDNLKLAPSKVDAKIAEYVKANPDMAEAADLARSDIVNGRDANTVTARNPNLARDVDTVINTVDPTGVARAQALARAKTLANYTSGDMATNVGQVNAAIQHIAELKQASDTLGKGQFSAPAANALLDKLSGTTGLFTYKDGTIFDAAGKPASDELAKMLGGGSATVSGIEAINSIFSKTASPEARTGAIQTLARDLVAKAGTYNQQFKNGVGDSTANFPIINQTSAKALDEIGQPYVGPQAAATGGTTGNGPSWSQLLNPFNHDATTNTQFAKDNPTLAKSIGATDTATGVGSVVGGALAGGALAGNALGLGSGAGAAAAGAGISPNAIAALNAAGKLAPAGPSSALAAAGEIPTAALSGRSKLAAALKAASKSGLAHGVMGVGIGAGEKLLNILTGGN
jgi:Phage tail lysozyme